MTIGERIKLARNAAGLSLRTVADKVGVSHTAISKYEQGLLVPDSSTLLNLAQALDVSIDYFFRPVTIVLQQVSFRKKARCPERDTQRIEAEVGEYLERYLQAEEIVNERVSFERPAIDCRVQSLDDIERVAKDLRQAWQLGLDPIENLVTVLEDRGVRVCLVEGCDQFDALGAWLPDGSPVIAVRRDIPGDRQRFNLAHELGHILLDLPPEWDGGQAEKAAHRFAAALLVPASAARAQLGEQRQSLGDLELHLLKEKYGLSMSAWVYRAHDLGIISDAVQQKIYRRHRRNGWYRVEPGAQLSPESPRRMEQLVYRALADDKVTRSRAAELLAVPYEELQLA